MKRLFTICGALFLCAYANAYDFEVDGIYYNILSEEDKTCEVTYKDEKKNSYFGDITIPNNANGYYVSSIGPMAFYDCSGLTSINIPTSVSSIGSCAFYFCVSLTEISIPQNVTTIETSAFHDCQSLTKINIPSSVTSIGSSAFSGCSGLTSITISMQDEADFASYLSRSDLNVFYVLPGEKHIISINGIQQTEIKIPSSVTSIGSYAFSKCTEIKSITIPSSVTSIGYNAFYNCTGLTSITIPNSVTSISSDAFAYCTGLTSITIPSSVTSIGSEAFNGCTGLTSITIPSSVTSIGASAFCGCSELSSLTIPNSVTSIGASAFRSCIKLSNITIPVQNIGPLSFFYCSGLTSVTFSSDVNKIDYSAFEGCTGLTSVTIPSSVTAIGNKAFSGCSALMSVTNYATTPQTITSTTFPDQGTLHVLSGYGDIYASTTGWKNFLVKEDATLPVEEEDADTYAIADGTEYSSTALTHVTTLKYSRTFSNTKWQALYIPFALSYSDISADLDIAWLNNVHMYDDNGDNEPDRTTLEFYIMNSGTTEPNTPYLVRAHNSGSFSLTLSDVDVSPAVCDPFECSTFTQTFTVYGTYTGVTGSDMVSNKYYAPSNGSLCYTTNTSASLKPQRWYLKVANKDGSAVTNLAPAIRVMIDGEMLDEEETAISKFEASPLSGSYVSIDGRSVTNPTAPGLYVHNNKKVFVR